MRKILFPTDFSKPAANAFLYALELAHQLDAEVTVLNAIFPQTEAIDLPHLTTVANQKTMEASREALDIFIAQGLVQAKGRFAKMPTIKKGIELGTPISTIATIAKRDNMDLIVMGSKGEDRSRIDKMLGSIAAGVVKQAHCPVIVVPQDTLFTGITSIAYATNIQEADPFELWKSIQLLSPYNPVIHVVHVNLKNEDPLKTAKRLEEMKAFFSDNHPGIQLEFHQFDGDDLIENLNDFIDIYPIDMLVMYQAHRGFWDRLFHRSATQKMAIYTHVPLLVQKETLV